MHLQRMSGATRKGDSSDARSGGAATGIDKAPVATMVIVEVGNTIALNVIGRTSSAVIWVGVSVAIALIVLRLCMVVKELNVP